MRETGIISLVLLQLILCRSNRTRKFPCMFTKTTDDNIEEDVNNAALFVLCAGELAAQKSVPRNIRKSAVPGTVS